MDTQVQEVIMPQLGVNDLEVTIVEWLVEDGVMVHTGQVLASVETSKAAMELYSEGDGLFFPVVPAGVSVTIRQVVGLLMSCSEPAVVQAYRDRLPQDSVEETASRVTEKAQRLIDEHKIDLALLPGDRIVRERDVRVLIPIAVPSIPDFQGEASRRVVIYGASEGGLAVLDCLKAMVGYEAVAFLDDDPALIGRAYGGLPVWPGDVMDTLAAKGIGSMASHIAKSTIRQKIFAQAQQAGLAALNVIHPAATVSTSVKMGVGNLIKAGAIVDCEVQLGDACIIDNGAVIPHHNIFGNGCHVAPGVSMGGGCRIGDRTVLGIGASLAARLRIGADVIVGTGACVVRDVPDGVIVEGNPAKIVGTRRG
jgi:sugar O-acyltransferase (sialic acid O-acetyltransferase NeuD family)